MCFNHLSEAHAHMSSFAANMSSLAKITNPKTFDMVMKVAAQPMIQINVLEHYLSPGPRSTPKDDGRRTPVLARKSPASLTGISHTGSMVWTHPDF